MRRRKSSEPSVQERILSKKILLPILIAVLLVGKMVGLESVHLSFYPVDIKLVAALLPLSMILGWTGIIGLTIGCATAHLVHFEGFLNVAGAATSAFLGSLLSYRLVKNTRSIERRFLGSWIITSVWALVFGTFFTLNYVPDAQIQDILSFGVVPLLGGMWIPVNLIGYLGLEILYRTGLADSIRKTLDASAWRSRWILKERKYCHNCGVALRVAAKFCSKCGEKQLM